MLIKRDFNKFMGLVDFKPCWNRFRLFADFIQEFRNLFSSYSCINFFIPESEYEKTQDFDNMFYIFPKEEEKLNPYKGMWNDANFYTHSMNNYLLFDDKKNLLEIENSGDDN